ncbi:MFS transporter [Violaceomyces palustris]|uniref:MFS transporter n=1 Tax=Violaceomyces palustris TaxID=1673888 RepID=A0ACD0NM40_9BASI|nr:MFS transporter [Violaceomyces palustris]
MKKLDWRAVPPLGLLWLANFIDRSNIGNAKVAGLPTDLHLKGNQLNIALAIFYIASEIPSNIILRKVGAKYWLPFIVAAWGIITTLSGLVQNFGGLCAIRIMLGLFEGGLLPGMPLYLSCLYPRHCLQVRIAYFYAGASLAGAFGGLLATGLIQMDGLGGLAGWRWIFIIEGIVTVIFAGIAVYLLPASVEKSNFLKEDEKDALVAVMGFDTMANRAKVMGVDLVAATDRVGGADEKQAKLAQVATQLDQEVFEWREVRRGLTEIQAWVTGLAYLCICNCLYSYSLFLPTILRGIYPTITTTRLQLLTVPPFVPATLGVLIIAYMADRCKMRGPFILGLLPLCMIGYIMLLVSNDAKVKYGATFLIALGIYPSAPCILSIPVNNVAGLYKRGTSNALQLMVANCAGFVATFVYDPKTAPKYIPGHSVALGSLVCAWLLIAFNVWWCWKENRAKREGRRDYMIEEYKSLVASGKTQAPIGDRSPNFFYTL